jgi:mRNA interferase MazF
MDNETKAHRSDAAITINRGDIFWVEPDAAKGSIPSVPHPHLVVQDDVFNRSRIATVVVCALTSNLNRASEPGNVLLESGEGNLPKRSVVISSQISSIDKSQLGERIGSICGTRVDQVIAALRFLQVSYFRDGQVEPNNALQPTCEDARG